jgi:hypothetical protein
MLDLVVDFQCGKLDLGELVRDLRGLFIEADPHDPTILTAFETVWSPIDAEHELRTERRAPPGMASDETLQRSLDTFRDWVTGVLAAESSEGHS